MADVFKLEFMEKCNCNRGFEVLYFCKSSECADNKTQKYYCVECSHDDGKHEHKSLAIFKELDAL